MPPVNGDYEPRANFFWAMELTVETEIACPHCGESFPLQIDTSQREQSLIEDCTVCCRPIALTIRSRPGEVLKVTENDA